MNDPLQNQRLNDLVIRVYRSLLQYANECLPWGGAQEETEQKTVAELAADQLHHLEPLAELVLARSQTIDYGIYPMDFGELHYVALDYLMHELLQNQSGLIATLEREQAAAVADAFWTTWWRRSGSMLPSSKSWRPRRLLLCRKGGRHTRSNPGMIRAYRRS